MSFTSLTECAKDEIYLRGIKEIIDVMIHMIHDMQRTFILHSSSYFTFECIIVFIAATAEYRGMMM